MNTKLAILLECLPEAPFKEQLKQAIKEEIEYEVQKARTMIFIWFSIGFILAIITELLTRSF